MHTNIKKYGVSRHWGEIIFKYVQRFFVDFLRQFTAMVSIQHLEITSIITHVRRFVCAS